MTPIIFTKKIDEEYFWFNMVSGGFVGVIFVNPKKEIMFQKETGKDLFRFPGGGIDSEDGDLIGLKSQKDFLKVAKRTAVREIKEETGKIINPNRLQLVGISNGNNEKDPKGGQVHMRVFFSYEFLLGEDFPNGIHEMEEDSHLEQYEYRWVPVQNGRADLEGKYVKVSKLHFAALIRFLRAPH
jgi:8-oxo-dGTP pyrophosphatase MutT (NUDIX family)